MSRARVNNPNTDDKLALLRETAWNSPPATGGVPVWDPEKKSRNPGCGVQVPFFAVGLF
jgi:hypothetical protein